MKALLPAILVGLGVALLVLGLSWAFIFPASRTWTDEKSDRMRTLQNEAHKLLYLADQAKTRPKPGGPSPQEAQQRFDDAKAELDKLKAEFEATRDTPKTLGNYLQYVGMGLVLVGGAGVMMGRGDG